MTGHAGPPARAESASREIPVVIDDGVSSDPFAALYDAADWVAFHGTSSAYIDSIEARGLSGSQGPWTVEECVAVCGIYEDLRWYGETHDPVVGWGFAVLKPWGPSRDIAISGQRHLYLAETYERAATYSHFPGGETTCALAVCLDDLLLFERDAKLREVHYASLSQELGRLGLTLDDSSVDPRWDQNFVRWVAAVRRAAHLTRDIGWLGEFNREFSSLRERLRQLQRAHRPVVYAVGLTPAHLAGARFGNMGIELKRPIESKHLLAKAFPGQKRPLRSSDIGEVLARDAVWSARIRESNAIR